MKKVNYEKLEEAHSRAQGLLGDLPPPQENKNPDFCNATDDGKRAKGPGFCRAHYVRSTIECLVDFHSELSAEAKNWEYGGHEKADLVKEWLRRTLQVVILLDNHLNRNLKYRLDLGEPEFASELLWLQSLFWDGGFARLLYHYDEFCYGRR